MVIDDDSWFKEKIEMDLFEELDKKKGVICHSLYMAK